MNEWKELKIDDLPPDILTGDYEFEGNFYGRWEHRNNNPQARSNFIENLLTRVGHNYRYRKPEPKAPTHKEIMV